MGIGSSRRKRQAKELTELEDQLEIEKQQSHFHMRVLMLGPGESGKSTILKQLKLIHSDEKAIREELSAFSTQNTCFENAINSMRCCINAVHSESFPNLALEAKAQAAAERVMEADPLASTDVAQATADDIQLLWATDAIKHVCAHREKFWIDDGAEYYFENVRKYASGAKPTKEDFIVGRRRTTGILESKFDINNVHWTVVDVGGQRSERRKWIRSFESVEAIVFTINLSGYSSVLFEDKETNRMQEAMDVFQDVISKPAFAETPYFLFFNKKDLFVQRLKTVPITTLFPDYTGDVNNVDESIEYIVGQFKALVPADKKSAISFHTTLSARNRREVRYSFLEMQEAVFQLHAEDLTAARVRLHDLNQRRMDIEEQIKGKSSKKRTGQSSQIDNDLLKAKLEEELNFKVLCLGAGESGKSTVIKQLNMLYAAPMTEESRHTYVQCLHNNIYASMKALINAAQAFGLTLSAETEAFIAGEQQEITMHTVLTAELAEKILTVWRDPAIQGAYAKRSDFWVLENVKFYLDNALRFTQQGFEPTNEDVVRARTRTSGIVESVFEESPVTWRVFDVGGQRSERKKWVTQLFDNVKAIVFFVNLAGYDSVLFEDEKVNRLEEAVSVFKNTIASDDYDIKTVPIFIFLNKIDLFEEQIAAKPLSNTFPDYTGPNEVHPCVEYLSEKFVQCLPTARQEDFREQCIFPISACRQKDVKYAFLGIRQVILSQKREQEYVLASALRNLTWFGADIKRRQ